ncbi:membrane-bound lytic murein transglycosylase MltF [Oceanobacter sp. 5_MG-2023]|uniref:membrane-bound lytic murein transglycosylase MltF n=1 Tax=Oceanobacter sp. 5_MG-2023 TaxID=3062645 RepID=UPI0026E27EDE|nr:membrane-bound lytic murein transglycosylase MltF [Oceanobacter sp. 5_MG-2023]MDO6681804.1 membrane-bound lytic murein transglycosylase MltF [Oceanobacter sp. 5_MG-2023]
MLMKSVKLLTGLMTLLVCLTAITGSVRPTQLEQIRMHGEITMITRNSPVTYYEDRTGPSGYELELAQAFADYLGVRLNVQVADNLTGIFTALNADQAQFAAAGLAVTPERQRWFRFSEPYQQVREHVIYRRGTQRPRKLDDMLSGMIVVPASSSHAQTLRRAQVDERPELSWSETGELDITDLMHMVANGDIDYTLVNSNEFNMLQAYIPNIGIGFTIDDERSLAWAFQHNRDNSLLNASREFFQSRQTRQQLATLNERYYGHLDELNYVGAKRFLRQTVRKLDRYKPYFERSANDNQFDWRLLAAVGYQESHWNPLATSYTGVRGLMMLTNATAGDLGVSDRLDPEQSILGGGRYLNSLRNRLGTQVAEPDRTWMTLASYNIGYGHLQDARRLAYEMGGNPNLWRDVKEALPLLSQKRYHKNTRYGYARGSEAVDYVQNIRRYYDVLVWNDEQALQIASTDNDNLHLSSSMTVVPPLL